MSIPEGLSLLMFVVACGGLMGGYNVAFTLSGVAVIFAAIGSTLGIFDVNFFLAFPGRIFPLITREILIAVPLFVFMGVMLEKSRIAEDLLESLAVLFGPLPGGLGVAVVCVGALLAASTGIVGATVVTMGLLSLPTMLQRGYSPSLAAGTIAASGTLGQIIPPSIVLVVLGDQISNAFQEAQRSHGLVTSQVVSVGDLFAGALLPGLILVGFYALYIIATGIFSPNKAPATPWPVDQDRKVFITRALKAMLPPIILVFAVLGSILSGYATPTRAAALGALGAMLLAVIKTSDKAIFCKAAIISLLGIIALVIMDIMGVDMRFGQNDMTSFEQMMIILALVICSVVVVTLLLAFWPMLKSKQLSAVSHKTMTITSMVFAILIGATIFSLIFRGLGGDELVARFLGAAPGGKWGALALVMIVMFFLGFFLDFLEITFVVVPLVAPPLLAFGIDPIWLGILMALNLQTSFLTPPFGFALFYLQGVSPPEITTKILYRGVIPFIAIQFIVVFLVVFFPWLATALPNSLLS
ncbi:MAG: TRAP transporter large permease subunit [Maricaulaceae bacterium]